MSLYQMPFQTVEKMYLMKMLWLLPSTFFCLHLSMCNIFLSSVFQSMVPPLMSSGSRKVIKNVPRFLCPPLPLVPPPKNIPCTYLFPKNTSSTSSQITPLVVDGRGNGRNSPNHRPPRLLLSREKNFHAADFSLLIIPIFPCFYLFETREIYYLFETREVYYPLGKR